ncbi:hypothetical protein RND81_04G103900 [Saponaria officinalis]|uniref:P-loop containing nucleoside triphosphate hydrolases superfamily protein n=1 Tax=Saponaria officinalis TaxID=3572 RepID=A0AAW1LKN0_SAPOF
MGGDHLHSFASEDESSILDNDDDCSEVSSYPSSFYRDGLRLRDEDESSRGSSGYLYKGFDELGYGFASNPVEFDNNLRRRKVSYNEIMRNYDELWSRRESLYQAKYKILSYSPGAWISNAGNKKLQDYALPITTSLLLVGPKGSGKSSLVNRISRVFEDDKFASERAQVTYNSHTGEGTFFLQEYMIPRSSTSFCLFDTRSLSEDFVDNDEMLKLWMMKGVRHGELVVRDSDNPRLRMSLKCKAQQSGTPSSQIRKINYVIFVVNGLSVLRSMNSPKEEAKRFMEMVTKTFNCPYLSFKDDKPVIVVTHGDLLSLGDRARVRVYLGEKLGVPPAKQIFDIPDNSDPLTELTIVDMIRYSLEHADKHMPCREPREWVGRSKLTIDTGKYEVPMSSILTVMFLAMLLGIACIAFPMHQSRKHNAPLPESANHWTSYPYEPRERLVTVPYSESVSSINYSQNRKPQVTSPQTLPFESTIESQGYENSVPEAKTSPTSPSHMVENRELENPEEEQANLEHEVTSLPSLSVSEKQEQESWRAEDDATSKPVKSVVTSRLKSDKEGRHKSRSPSPEKKHPKSAVKWHKIRHLWLDE